MSINNFTRCEVMVTFHSICSYSNDSILIHCLCLKKKGWLFLKTVVYSFYRQSCHNIIWFGIIISWCLVWGMQITGCSNFDGHFPNKWCLGVTFWKCKLWVLNPINMISKFCFVSLPIQKTTGTPRVQRQYRLINRLHVADFIKYACASVQFLLLESFVCYLHRLLSQLNFEWINHF